MSTLTASASAMKRAFVGAVEDEYIMYSDVAHEYHIGQPIGFGASSTVYYATWQPHGHPALPCALKVIDLDGLPPHALPLLRRETQLMALSKHPNVLRVRGSWTDGHKLYIALRLMRSGSVADVMRYGWSGGFEEEVIKCALKQALEGLNYLHVNGFIHRDVKAANLLIDEDGTVLLGDLGVAVSLTEEELPAVTTAKRTIHFEGGASPVSRDSGDRGRPRLRHKRKSFVGTPCWMAPEVISQKHYDSQADMWSFGITALELSQGRPPYSREPSHRALMKIIQDDPPTLNRDGGDQKYSRAFKDIIDSCLSKDPAKRPTAEQLLATPFFKSAKKKTFLVDKILAGLPPLKDRQERRRLPSGGSHTSIGSWDFTHTVHSHATTRSKPGSPTTSIHHHHRQSSLSLPPDAVFEIEEDADAGSFSGVDGDGARGILVREPDALDDGDDSGVIHMKPAPLGRRRGPTHGHGHGPGHGQHPLMFGSPISESDPSPDSVSDEDDLPPLPEPVIAGARPIPAGMSGSRAPDGGKGSAQSSESSSSVPSASGSGSGGGAKLWRMISGKSSQPRDDGGTGPPATNGGRKPSFSARVSGMFSSSTTS